MNSGTICFICRTVVKILSSWEMAISWLISALIASKSYSRTRAIIIFSLLVGRVVSFWLSNSS